MFKAPFSFEGRIRRSEYGLSFVVILVASFFVGMLSALLGDAGPVLILLFYIPMCWFAWAQGAKRSHDLGNSGWFQLIPFYGLWLLFADSQYGENKYGLNPKGLGNEDSYEDQINQIGNSLKS